MKMNPLREVVAMFATPLVKDRRTKEKEEEVEGEGEGKRERERSPKICSCGSVTMII
jgi:hypothetical protein